MKKDLEKINLARKHVLDDRELGETRFTIESIAATALDRIESLRSASNGEPGLLAPGLTHDIGIFEQHNLKAEDKFKSFAAGLVCALALISQGMIPDFGGRVKYKLSSMYGITFDGERLRDLPESATCGDDAIPDPDSIPLSVLNHPPGKRHEINFNAYDPPELTLSPTEGTHAV